MELGAHKLSRLGTFFNVHDEFLLALFELGALAVEFALRFCQGALVLTQPFCGCDGAAEEGFL